MLFRKVKIRKLKKAAAVLEEKIQEDPGAFRKVGPIFQQPFSLPESAQALAGIARRAAGKSGKNNQTASKFAGKPFQQGIRTAAAFSIFLIRNC